MAVAKKMVVPASLEMDLTLRISRCRNVAYAINNKRSTKAHVRVYTSPIGSINVIAKAGTRRAGGFDFEKFIPRLTNYSIFNEIRPSAKTHIQQSPDST